MIGRRILVNLVVFVAIFFLLLYWAVTNVVRVDAIDRPYRVTAYFSTSPGLRNGFEVAYLGLRVGSIGSVELIEDPAYCGDPAAEEPESDGQALTGACVAVELKIDRGTELPANVTPHVRRKSAVGEPYVDLVVAPSGGEGQLQAGDHLTDGQLPLAYSDLFTALDDLVQAVPEDSLGIFFRELALGLEGRAADIRRLLESAEDLTGTLAADPAFLDDLATQLTTLTHTLATNRESFGSAIDNLAALADSLAANREVITRFLDASPAFAAQLTDLLDQVDGDLTCALRSLSVVATDLSQPDTLAQVERLLDVAAEAGTVLGGSLREQPDGTWITGGFQFNVANGTPVPAYPQPGVLPAPPALRSCDLAFPAAGGAGGRAGSLGGGTPAADEENSPATATERPAAEPEPIGESTGREADDSDLIGDLLGALLPIALIAAVLGLAALALKPWRWLGAGATAAAGDSDGEGGGDTEAAAAERRAPTVP